jgi:hypothetical protein
MRVFAIALLSLPLAGCFGLTMPPPPLPDWAMRPQGEWTIAARPKTVRRVPAHRGPGQAVRSPTGAQADVLPFSAAWQAREDALDARLRRSMNICTGC